MSELFWKLASPTTLASLIADLQNVDEWTDEIVELRSRLMDELVAIVGDDEAAGLLAENGVAL